MGLSCHIEGQDSISRFFFFPFSPKLGRQEGDECLGICVAHLAPEILADVKGSVSVVWRGAVGTDRERARCEREDETMNFSWQPGRRCTYVSQPVRVDEKVPSFHRQCVKWYIYVGRFEWKWMPVFMCMLLGTLLILDICLTVDTGGVWVPAVTRQPEHLSAAARNHHRRTWSTLPKQLLWPASNDRGHHLILLDSNRGSLGWAALHAEGDFI